MLVRRAPGTRYLVARFAHNPYPTRDSVRAVFGNLNPRLSILIDLNTGLHMVDAVAECARWTGPYCLNNFVHSPTAWSNERLGADVEDG